MVKMVKDKVLWWICGFFLPPSSTRVISTVPLLVLVGLSSQLSAETKNTWKTLIFSDFVTGWARYYDVQTPLRDGGFLHLNPTIRTDGYEVRKANTPRIGQPYILTLTHRLSNKDFYFDSAPYVLMMVPLAVGQADPSSPASTLNSVGIANHFGKLTSLNHPLGDQLLRFGLVSMIEQTRFQNLFSAHLRRAWLVGGEVQWGNLSSLSIQLKALTSVVDSFRLDTRRIISTAITTSTSNYNSIRLSASRHLVRRLIGEIAITHSPSRVTLRDFSDYQNLGLRVRSNSSQKRSIELTTTAVTLGMRKVF